MEGLKAVGGNLVELQTADDKRLTISADFLPDSEEVRTALAALYQVLPHADITDIIGRLHWCQGLRYHIATCCALPQLCRQSRN